MTDIRRVLREEMEELERQLEADPRFKKLQNLQNLLALYEEDEGRGAPAARARPVRGSSTDRDRALQMTEELLDGRVTPTRTSDILEYLIENGVIIEGQSPVSNLSAMLSRAPQFEPHGRAGWTIVTPLEDLLAADGRSESHQPDDKEDSVEALLG